MKKTMKINFSDQEIYEFLTDEDEYLTIKEISTEEKENSNEKQDKYLIILNKEEALVLKAFLNAFFI